MTTLTPTPPEILDALRLARRVLVVTHRNPDGDALGSSAAFARIAQSLGKDVRLYCETPVPDNLTWLPMPAPMAHAPRDLDGWQPDLVVVLDCADGERAGSAMAALLRETPETRGCATLSIDHHAGNPLFGDINWVDPDYCATGALIGELAHSLELPLTGELGRALYLALVSDSGSFSYANTNAQALRLAAEIVENGLSIADFTQEYENNWSLSRMRLWGEIMNEVRLECDGRVAVSVVTAAHLEKYGLKPDALEDYASWLRRLAGVRVVVLARTAKHGAKVSLRSMGEIDVQKIAAHFGGGGHVAAAGIDMKGDPGSAAEAVLAELRKHFA